MFQVTGNGTREDKYGWWKGSIASSRNRQMTDEIWLYTRICIGCKGKKVVQLHMEALIIIVKMDVWGDMGIDKKIWQETEKNRGLSIIGKGQKKYKMVEQ